MSGYVWYNEILPQALLLGKIIQGNVDWIGTATLNGTEEVDYLFEVSYGIENSWDAAASGWYCSTEEWVELS